MIPFSAAAEAELEALTLHYALLGRDQAINRLMLCIRMACARFERGHGLFYDAPRPYPWLSDRGFRWTKEGPYWVAFAKTNAGPVVVGVFHASADLSGRL